MKKLASICYAAVGDNKMVWGTKKDGGVMDREDFIGLRVKARKRT